MTNQADLQSNLESGFEYRQNEIQEVEKQFIFCPYSNPDSKLQIVEEIPDLLLIDKPPFLLVHPTKPNGPITLWHRLKELLAYENITGGQISLINRLDRETSGLILIAKNYQAARTCAMAMEAGAIKKEYLALVWGWLGKEEQIVDAPLLRLGKVASSQIWLKQAIHPEGSPAVTKVHVEKKLSHPKKGPITLVRCFPQTGRTHQIRVHLASLGHPIIGDKIYGPTEECYLNFIETGWTTALEEKLWLSRQALHSTSLELSYNNQQYRWNAPLAKDLAAIVNECNFV
ncbi:MAG: RluA family pseudouridine synthase [Chthoniobacterales bacterium]|nr:RluA family pseudouridine synthase [Chthoniobacterales bacterium]